MHAGVPRRQCGVIMRGARGRPPAPSDRVTRTHGAHRAGALACTTRGTSRLRPPSRCGRLRSPSPTGRDRGPHQRRSRGPGFQTEDGRRDRAHLSRGTRGARCGGRGHRCPPERPAFHRAPPARAVDIGPRRGAIGRRARRHDTGSPWRASQPCTPVNWTSPASAADRRGPRVAALDRWNARVNGRRATGRHRHDRPASTWRWGTATGWTT